MGRQSLYAPCCAPCKPARRQKDRNHSQWTPIAGGSATRGRHHLGISFNFIQPVLKTCRPIRRSSAPGRTQIQGAHLPRTSLFQTVQARGPRHRDRGPVERGSNNFPPLLGRNKGQSSSKHPPQSCRGFLPLTLVSHPDHAFAASLLDVDCSGTSNTDGDTTSISQLLSDDAAPNPAQPSPARG